jgi:thioredoxin 1
MTLLLGLFIAAGCNGRNESDTLRNREKAAEKQDGIEEAAEPEISYKVTFLELGSVGCIPCKMMRPIMKQIEEKYPDVKVVFHDVRKPEGKEYARKYNIRVIPTQVFLDKDGKEYFRHEGFFPEEEVEKVLARGGAGRKEE